MYFLRYFILIVLIAICASWFSKSFLWGYYEIPSESMEPTLHPGDGILVSKIWYGPRIDLSLILGDTSITNTYKLPGFSTVQRSDVVVFRSPFDRKLTLIKRCVALPGDTLKIVNSDLFVNNVIYPDTSTKFNFTIISKDSVKTKRYLSLLSFTADSSKFNGDMAYYFFSLTKPEGDKIKSLRGNDTVLMAMSLNKDNGKVFPRRLKHNWIADNYGPLIIPKKGVSIVVDSITIPLYYAVIKAEEKKVRIKGNHLYINDAPITSYNFKNNYYFMMGDNRNHSFDSRWLGFISDKLIIGKAAYIIHSKHKRSQSAVGNFYLKAIH